MRYREIPRTDLQVSALCLGTAQMGTSVSESESFRILDQFVDEGGNFIDTARAYAIWVPGGEGISEAIIGKWLKERGYRDTIVVGTKGAHPAWTSMNKPRLSRHEILQDCEQSLQSLRIDTLKLYWLHRDDPSRPLSDIFETLETLRESGKIRYYGFSNWSTERMYEAVQYATDHGVTGFVANQPMWSFAKLNAGGLPDPTCFSMDDKMRVFHQETSLPVIPYTAQAKGFFSKWARDGLANLNPSLVIAYDNPTNRLRYENVKRLSEETGHSITALAVAWLISQPDFVTIPVVTGSVSQLTDVMKAGDITLARQILLSME